MKGCPTCGTQYSDDTLQFCLRDGTPLPGGSASDTPTVALSGEETVVARSGIDRTSNPVGQETSTRWQNSQVTQVASAFPPKKGSNTLLIVAVLGFVLLVVLGVLGAGGYWILTRNAAVTARNTANNANSGNANNSNGFSAPSASPTASRTPASPSPSVTANNAPTPTPPVDEQQTRNEISQGLDSWKSQAESRNVNGYMSHYAPTVDYYNKPGSSFAAVRADKMRAFSQYNVMRVNLSNMSVTTDPSGQTATAEFDKEWDFQGNGSSAGKVRQMMRFSKINGQWLITAEKDLKLYYKR